MLVSVRASFTDSSGVAHTPGERLEVAEDMETAGLIQSRFVVPIREVPQREPLVANVAPAPSTTRRKPPRTR